MPKTKSIIESTKENDMEQLLKLSTPIRVFKSGDVIEGVVVSVNHNEVLIDVGAKSEGVISGKELVDEFGTYKTLKIGDKVLTAVVQAEDASGHLVLSLRRAEKERRWRELVSYYNSGMAFDVKVLEYNKGGILVDALGLRGFVPISHLNKAHFAEFNKASASGSLADISQKLSQILGETLRVKVIEIDRAQNRIVLSEKEIEQAKNKEEIQKKLKGVKVGSLVKGKVIAVLPFGILVDINGIDGLVHVSELSWERVTSPAELYKVGDTVKVKVLSVDEKEGKLALSLKSLKDNPWAKAEEKYAVGTIVKGKVSKVMPFGAFVQIEPGIEGLIHVSETAGPLNVNENVKAMVILVDAKSQKLALSIRQIEEAKIYK